MTCARCNAPLDGRARFEITRFDGNDKNRGTVTTCGLLCLVQWAYAATTMRGAMAVGMARNTITNLITSIRGPKR
jgi:hypothetical protein